MVPKRIIKAVSYLAVLAVVLVVMFNHTYDEVQKNLNVDTICREDIRTGKKVCRPSCPFGYFILPGMTSCHRWLNCSDDIKKLNVLEEGNGHVKLINKAVWKGYNIVINNIKPERRSNWSGYYFMGRNNIRNFQPSEHVIQLVGFCGWSFSTEFHALGSADNLEKVLQSPDYQKYDTLETRLKICKSYVEVLHMLHNNRLGTRVLCDTDYLDKTVRQFLITTDLRIIVNDIDYIPEVNSAVGMVTSCDTYEGEFVAPEQRRGKNSTKYTSTDEKSDIWKIPTVCKYFLGAKGTNASLPQLSNIHARCKKIQPTLRPSAAEVIKVYDKILSTF